MRTSTVFHQVQELWGISQMAKIIGRNESFEFIGVLDSGGHEYICWWTSLMGNEKADTEEFLSVLMEFSMVPSASRMEPLRKVSLPVFHSRDWVVLSQVNYALCICQRDSKRSLPPLGRSGFSCPTFHTIQTNETNSGKQDNNNTGSFFLYPNQSMDDQPQLLNPLRDHLEDKEEAVELVCQWKQTNRNIWLTDWVFTNRCQWNLKPVDMEIRQHIICCQTKGSVHMFSGRHGSPLHETFF